MPRRGPGRTPTKILQMRGSHRGVSRADEIQPKTMQAFRCPRGLDKESREEWKRVTTELKALGIIAEFDRSMLIALCQSWSDYVRFRETVLKKEIYKTDGGYIQQHPAVILAGKALDKYIKLAKEFGMSPSSRAGLTGGKTGKGNDLDDELARRRKERSNG